MPRFIDSIQRGLGQELGPANSPTFAGLGATPIVSSYVGPHALGGVATNDVRLNLLGDFTGSSSVAGLIVSGKLTPTLANAMMGSMFGNTFQMVPNQVHPLVAQTYFNAPVITTATGASVTTACTVYIGSAPTGGVTNYAFNVGSGACRFGGLTASLPIVTDASKVLTSIDYTGATSLRKNLGLETSDSPTFAGIVIADAGTIGLGSGKGLIQFDDETVDTLSFLNCNVGIGTTAPGVSLEVYKAASGIASVCINAPTDGTGYYSELQLGNNYSTNRASIRLLAASFTNNGANIGDAMVVGSSGSGGLNLVADDPNTGMIRFYTDGSADGNERMRIANNGNVGIGTTAPSSKLSINGGIHVGGDSDAGDNNLLVDGTGTITGAFGCNTKTAQTAYASGGALAAYGAGANGLDSGANMAALHALVVSIRAALVANGIMS
jgi:hypothetical protein